MGFKPHVQLWHTWPRTPGFLQPAWLASFQYCKGSKTVLPNSPSARDFQRKIAATFCEDRFSIASPPFGPIYEQAAKIAKPCKNNLKAQWELDFVAFLLRVSRRGWQSRFRCSWERSVNRPVCVLAGLLAMTPEKAELIGAAALHAQSPPVNALRPPQTALSPTPFQGSARISGSGSALKLGDWTQHTIGFRGSIQGTGRTKRNPFLSFLLRCVYFQGSSNKIQSQLHFFFTFSCQ